MPSARIGEYLVAQGLLTTAAINRALGYQRSAAPRVRLGSILLTWDLLSEGELLRALAALHRCEAVTGAMLAGASVDAVRMLPASHAVRLNALPYALEESRIRVAFVNPSDLSVLDEVSALTGRPCRAGVATELRLLQAQRRFYGRAIPFELRPTLSRTTAGAASLSVGVSPAHPLPAVPVPIGGGPSGGAADAASIRVPDLPIPPPPPARPPGDAMTAPPAPEAWRTDGDPESMWLASVPEPALSEAAEAMWSPGPVSAREPGESVADLALEAVPAEFPRAILLLAERGGVLAGWRARGVALPNVASLRLSTAEPSVFAAVVSTGTPHFGRVDPELWPHALSRLFDGPPPCAVFPVQSGRGVSAVLYADRRGAPLRFEDTALLARAAARIASLLARGSSAS